MADISVTIIFKDAHVTRILDAFNDYADLNLTIRPEGQSEWRWSYLPKQGGESNIEFGERVLKELIRAFVRCREYNDDVFNRYNVDVQTVTLPSQNVPDDIVD